MTIAVLCFNCSVGLWLVYYAREFAYLSSSAALVLYVGLPIVCGLIGLLIVPFMPWMVDAFMPKEFRGSDDQGNQSGKSF